VHDPAQQGHRLVEAAPALGEGDARRLVVESRRSGAQPCDQPAAGQRVESTEQLCRLYGPAQRRERNGRGDGQVTGGGQHGRQGGRTVEPRPGEHEVVVRTEVAEAGLTCLPCVGDQVVDLRQTVAEVDQRQVGTELHRHAPSRAAERRFSIIAVTTPARVAVRRFRSACH
jgi:hypothetical protein